MKKILLLAVLAFCLPAKADTITAITVTPVNSTCNPGDRVQMVAVDQLGNDITNIVTWSSSKSADISIAPGGIATCLQTNTDGSDSVVTISASVTPPRSPSNLQIHAN